MQKSRLKMLGQLYLKDMHDLKAEIIIVLAITLLLDTWIYYISGYRRQVVILPTALSVGLVVLIPLMTMGLAAFIPLVSSFKMLGREWNSNTVYLIMSLPVSGTMIMISKLLAVLSQFLIGTLVAGVTGGLMLWNIFPEVQPFITQNVHHFIYLYLMLVVLLLYLTTSSFLSQVIGHLSRRYSGLITTAIFIVIIYVVGKITDVFDGLFPTIHSGTGNIISGAIWYYIGMYFVAALLLMALTVYIYDHKVEL